MPSFAPNSPGRPGPTVAIETHGCKLNQADSSSLAWQFVEAGFRLVRAHEPADVFVLNTCTVTHIADRKARQALRAARRRNPNGTIVATGCYAQRAPDAIHALEEVDIVAGNVDKPTLVRKVSQWRGGPPVPCAVGDDVQVDSPRIARTRAMVKIQEGCNQVCAYCIVPRVRGRERSVAPEEIIAQIGRYLSLGYKEVVLTGTQLGSYGFDLTNIDLAALVDRVLSETAVVRLRISSLQPQEISTRLLRLWSDHRLCPHFHLPLQSGSERVLTRMRRRYTPRSYARAVEMVRQSVPHASVTADVVVGFPGESDRDFEETYAFCEEIGFAATHVFPYSIRPGTSAAHFKDQVDPIAKSSRVRLLLRLAEEHAAAFRDRSLGTVRPVLWEEARETDGATVQRWTGLTDNYLRVAAVSPLRLVNQITPAKLIRREGDLVHARVVD